MSETTHVKLRLVLIYLNHLGFLNGLLGTGVGDRPVSRQLVIYNVLVFGLPGF